MIPLTRTRHLKQDFDRVSHGLLKHKLGASDNRGDVLRRIVPFVYYGTFGVNTGSELSSPTFISSVVPQGSVPSSTLFPTYINDLPGYNSERAPNVRVTVLEDPNNSLQELFNPVSQRQQVPLHQRNLPRSFFVPPVGINDSTHLTDPTTTDLVISHSKANSSPACLDAPLCTSLDTIIPSHTHQKSLEVSADYSQGYCHETSLSDVAKCLNQVTR
ncbi:uncharacterized protein DEA37_0000701 [Paragonimus westermani]|uniref:Uncharacterized protein n=1 Tax=Paragonimus westermani TaxID=34504 RepID=A0A5J4P1M4_9TREM|nr:uncharacterized protein DEA37_0000701 [Paragonimus westermani]